MIKIYKGSRRISIKAYGHHPRVKDLDEAIRKLCLGDAVARDEIILGHINLAGAVAATYAAQTGCDPDDAMSVAMLALCDAVDRISLGSCPHGNIGAYINKCVNGRVDEFISRDFMIRPPQYRERKDEPIKVIPLTFDIHVETETDLGLFESSHFTPREREILRMKYEGYTEGEIVH